MSTNQRTVPCPFSFFLFTLLFCFVSINAETLRWPDAFHNINFGANASSPFRRFSPADFSSAVNVWASFLPQLGSYGGHVWTVGKLEYNLDLTSSSFPVVDVKLGFAEVYLPLCNNNGRIMRISVNDDSLSSVNIFALAGCRSGHDLVFEGVRTSAPIKVLIEGVVENPMISNIVVREASKAVSHMDLSNAGIRDDASISRSFGAFNKVLLIYPSNTNPVNGIPRTSVFIDKSAIIEGTIRPDILNGHRHGMNFTYHIKGSGTYEIQLAFAETNPTYCEGLEERVFSVFFNGETELEDVNVFQGFGCRRAFIHTSPSYVINSNLFITFTGMTGNAMISHILVRQVKTSCVPESTADAATSDHLAHSVPGQYPPITSASSPTSYVDNDNDGFETVFVNGRGSHTHFFDTENSVVGRITSYEWTSPDTTEFISDKVSFNMKFMLGTTRLSLRVEDNICSSHVSETSVTVMRSVASGTYCYFYPGQVTMLAGGGPDQEIKPSFARSYPGTNWDFSDLDFSSSDFAARCEFFVSVLPDATTIQGSVSTQGTGLVSLLRGADVLIDNQQSSSFSESFVSALSSFEILYLHAATQGPPMLQLAIDSDLNPSFSYDRNTVFPVIRSLSPSQSSLSGVTSASVEVLGASLLNVAEVLIGNDTVPVTQRATDSRKLFFTIPSSPEARTASISLKWEGGFISNMLTFTYSAEDAKDPIGFTEHLLVSGSGSPLKSELASSIRIGYDGNIYLGTLNAIVIKLRYDPESLRVSQRCQSEPLEDSRFSANGTVASRAILGMAFHPSERDPRPYVSTQTLFWLARNRIDENNPDAWKNGAIDRLKPGKVARDKSICLVYDERIVSGLPVSNHDHGVNGLEFTQKGDLIISIGGNTNAGLPGEGLGSRFETPLSGSIILAKLSKGSAFDGVVEYTNGGEPHRLKVAKGDIEIIATGVRNGFFPSLHSSGRLYLMDNGPNAGFGNVASNCEEINDTVTYSGQESGDYPGLVELGPSSSKYSVERPDKLLNIKLDGTRRFYGHPNPNRRECFFVDPFTDKGPTGESPPSNYDPPLLTFSSSTNAIVEYHAGNVFNGSLKGNLILSTYQNQPTHHIPPITEPQEISPSLISPSGGLSLVVDAWGQMIIPRLSENNILVLRPRVPSLEAREEVSITAVVPFRHTMYGLTLATIGGYNFGPGIASVWVGSSPCEVLSQSLTKIICRTPRASKPGTLESVTVEIDEGGRAVLPDGVWYSEV